jgi:hypothetical protein
MAEAQCTYGAGNMSILVFRTHSKGLI